jgi:hypothetical protein
MAKSGKARASVLLAVLAVAVSLHAAHSAPPEIIAESLSKVSSWIDSKAKLTLELKEKTDELKDRLEVILKNYGHKDMKLHYLSVTDIKVDGNTVEGISGVILFATLPFPFISKTSFGQLKDKLPDSAPNQFNQRCYASGTGHPRVTLVLAVTEKELELPWMEQRGGLMCLGILQGPWT